MFLGELRELLQKFTLEARYGLSSNESNQDDIEMAKSEFKMKMYENIATYEARAYMLFHQLELIDKKMSEKQKITFIIERLYNDSDEGGFWRNVRTDCASKQFTDISTLCGYLYEKYKTWEKEHDPRKEAKKLKSNYLNRTFALFS